MTTLSPHERLLASIFGVTPGDEQRLAETAAATAAAEAAQNAADWARADEVRAAAQAAHPQHKWHAALAFGWQACAIAIVDGAPLRAEFFGDQIGISTPAPFTIENTEVKV